MITQELISRIVGDSKLIHRRTDFHEDIDEIREDLKPHFENEYPEKLLEGFRKAEKGWMKEERMAGWQSPTIPATSRIKNLLHKIRQADDFKIDFPSDSEVETGLTKANSFKDYLTVNLPVVKNLEDWIFGIFQEAYLADPNAVCFVGAEPRDYIEGRDISLAYPQIICSEDLVLVDPELIVWQIDKEEHSGKKEFFAVSSTDAAYFWYWTKDYKDEGGFPFTLEVYSNVFKSIPAKQVGSVIGEVEDNKPIFNSLVTPALPPWNIALRRQDDNEIIWVKYAYPKEWEIGNGNCKTCKGSGKTTNNKGESTCQTCGGQGYTKSDTPFNVTRINITQPNALNPSVATVPTPPMGTIERPIEILKEFRTEISEKILEGLKSLGLENLYVVPLATSGESKIQDKKEVHTLLYQVAVHYVSFYVWAAEQLYYQRYASMTNQGLLTEEQRLKTIPQATIPTEFDILTAADLSESLAFAKEKNLGPEVEKGLRRSLLVKLYGEDSPAVKEADIRYLLDPLPNVTLEELALLKETGLVSDLDALLKVRKDAFITQIITEDPKWWEKPFAEKQKSLYDMAQAQLDKITQTRVNAIDLRA